MIINSQTFSRKETKGKERPSDLATRLKILTSKQMVQIFPIALSQVKTGNAFENLLNKITKIAYSLHRAKEINNNVYNNTLN